MNKLKLTRSFLYVPAYIESYIDSALASDTDVIILDLEDSVPFFKKEKARKNILNNLLKLSLFKGQIIVRINNLENETEVKKDLNYLKDLQFEGIMLPKINVIEDLEKYDALISEMLNKEDLYYIPLIETALSMIHLDSITKFSKVEGLAFGGEDYITDLQGKHGKTTILFDYARIQIVIAAKAYQKIAIDTPFLALDEHIEFVESVKKASELGFDGKQCIHPSQIHRVNEILTPHEDEYHQAVKIVSKINEAEEKGKGVAIFNGKMIGPPMVKRAKKLITIYEKIKEKSRYGSE
ncbi:HpcH/HpaI aldolase/citrate lyase family protein [Lysinibacillus sp. 3P01SB]|uniref:HpcH/HpaI aldolase/citrate lyase family protein n=1 Tax=Lysinibacillus sp. 3P01SB TaxID=3132284 RepID=UPI0039A44F4B